MGRRRMARQGRPVKVGSIHQTVILPGTPREVYTLLTTSKGHIAFTGADARISPRVGGRFMAWGGYIHGTNLSLIPGRTVYQTWVPSDPTWPKGHESRVRYSLSTLPRRTRVTFTHSRVPTEHIGHLSPGWKKSYWDPLRAYLTKQGGKAGSIRPSRER
jgi:uncharacterized protein YndB with AHSA1/START domain